MRTKEHNLTSFMFSLIQINASFFNHKPIQPSYFHSLILLITSYSNLHNIYANLEKFTLKHPKH